MKYLKNITAAIIILIIFSGCEEEFLNRSPKDELSEATAFSTYNNVKVYAWNFYDFFDSYQRKTSGYWTEDCDGDLIENGYATAGQSYLWDRVIVPNESSVWNDAYTNIRRVNLMLDNLASSDMTESEIAHWRGVGLFFRSYEYFGLLQSFGGIPWTEHALTDGDEELLFGPRDNRNLVAENILRDLQEAVNGIKEDGDGANTINANVARALLSRFALFEVTWRKYHGLGDHEKYLNACISASEKLLADYPTLMPVYDQVFNSENLAGKPGIILYKHFIQDVVHHWVSTNTRSTNNKMDVTRKGIDMFLCKDGKTIWNSDLYQGDKNPYAEFKNRDTRILVMTPPPYKVNGDGTVDKWTHTGDPVHQEWFAEMERVSGGYPNKVLPDLNWSGRCTGEVPNFTGLTPTQTSSGYRFWKYYNDVSYRISSKDFNDAPLFRMGEVLVNYAEAKFEMGSFDQSVADATINKVRARGEVAPMVVAEINTDFDPTRDPEVDPVLWEIRRERAIELMGEGFRREELRRWKKMHYASEPKLGRWVKQSDYNRNLPIQNNAAEGYIQLVPGTPPSFPEHYYLLPIPSGQMVLNPQLEQNPGWPLD